MSSIFDIEKEVEKARFVVEKRGVDPRRVRAKFGTDLDVSGSMRVLYDAGIVQRVVERILALALTCDDDGIIDIWGFSNRAKYACSGNRKNYRGIVQQEIMDEHLEEVRWGGTEYAPAIQANLDHYGLLAQPVRGFLGRLFGGVQGPSATLPVVNYFVTDGENSDEAEAWALFEQIRDAKAQIYYVLIGVGNESFSFLRRAANSFPNVGFLSVPDLAAFVADDAVYEQLLPQELSMWLNQEQEGGDHGA